jgi:hypothetical protein
MRDVWREIHDWYYRNGFFETAENMDEIKKAWRRFPESLLILLKRHAP